MEIELRKMDAEKKAKVEGRKEGAPLIRTPPGRSQSVERRQAINRSQSLDRQDRGRKRTTISPADERHEEKETKKAEMKVGRRTRTKRSMS